MEPADAGSFYIGTFAKQRMSSDQDEIPQGPKPRLVPTNSRGMILRGLTSTSAPEPSSRSMGEQRPQVVVGSLTATGPTNTCDELEQIKDWFIPEGNARAARIYPDDCASEETILRHAIALEAQLSARRAAASISKDFRLPYEGLLFKGHIQETVDGIMFILRRVSKRLPSIHVLGLPSEIKRILLDGRLTDAGGLIIIAGAHGQGKSTTAASLVVERVISAAAFCLTVEDPPEFILHGDHAAIGGRRGKIIQVAAETDRFAFALRDAMRCYPSSKRGSILFIGEVRDDDTASQTLKAANNGQLVITTIHSSDPISALDRLIAFAQKELGEVQARAMLGHGLRAVVHQSLHEGTLEVSALFSKSPRSAVGATITAGLLRQLSTELERQSILIKRGELARQLDLSPSSA